MSDIAMALMNALGLGKGSAPQAPPNTSADPWNDPSLAAKPVRPNPAAMPSDTGGPQAMGGSGSTDRDKLDQIMMEILKQKQMASVAGGQIPPNP